MRIIFAAIALAASILASEAFAGGQDYGICAGSITRAELKTAAESAIIIASNALTTVDFKNTSVVISTKMDPEFLSVFNGGKYRAWAGRPTADETSLRLWYAAPTRCVSRTFSGVYNPIE